MNVDLFRAMSGLSTHTQRAYQRWIKTYTGVNDLSNVDPKKLTGCLNVGAFKGWLGRLKAQELGKQSLGQAKAAVVWLAQFLCDAGHLSYEVPAVLGAIKLPRAEAGQRAGTWLTADEVRALIRAASESRNSAIGARDTAIIMLMVLCGLRRDEIVTLRWRDAIDQGGTPVLRIHGKGEKMRIVKLPGIVREAITAWRTISDDTEYIFVATCGTNQMQMTPERIWKIVRYVAARAGLPTISPHDLRRSFARGAYESGASFELIRQTLGHANIATTERYVNAALELKRAATDIWAEAVNVNGQR